MLANWTALILMNFDFAMLILAVFFMVLNRIVTKGRVPEYEIIYRWLALFCVGFLGVYAFILHSFYPELAANTIGWVNSPFQYEVAAIADLAFGVIGVLSFNASFGFRLATVIGNTIWLWGDALGHINRILQAQNNTMWDAGPWLLMDIILPVLLILCLSKLKPRPIHH
jgi:hypothetical protein